MKLSDDSLRGRTVIASDVLAIGDVASLFCDTEDWRVESLQIKLRAEIADRVGADRHLFHAGVLKIPTRLIQSVGDAVVLAVAVDELRQLLVSASELAPAH